MKTLNMSKRIKKHDLIFFICFIILLIILISSDLIYPFSRYLAYRKDAADIIPYYFPPIWITIVFLITGALLFISWSFYSKKNIKIILILSGLFLVLIGPLSIGKIFNSDAIYHVGIINRILNNMPIPFEKIIHYPGLVFHYLMLPFSILFTPYNAILYVAPIISFIVSIPLGNRLIKIPKDFKNKLTIGILYFWSGPIFSSQKLNSTPYALLISIYSLLIFFLLSEKRYKFCYSFFLAVIGSLVHIHGIFMFIILFSALVRKRFKDNKKYYISQILTSILYMIPFLMLVFSKDIIIKNHSLYEYGIALDNKIITFVLYTLSKPGGYLSEFFLPKILPRDLFSLYYIGQLVLFFIFLILVFIKFFKVIYQKVHISYTSFFDKTKDYDLLPLISSISYHLIILMILGLFFSYNLQLWRFFDILILIGFLLLLYKFYPIIKKIKIRYIYILTFVFIVFSPIIAYNQYTPYNENEEKLVQWSLDYYEQSNESTYLFMDRTTYKLFWALAPELERDLYQWESYFWLTYNYSLYEYFDWQKDLNLLIILTPKNLAREAQFNNVNLTEKINQIIDEYSTKWLYIDDEGNKILGITLDRLGFNL
ncbi:hypothetical protein LCGC14_1856180 [marine sediment metagenome]|uniref:Uncharacterized protein n=1 Tax=marine sediment metagenome TaxID=412755 RepID=A0A0F9G9B9_9ZZZZ